MEDLSASKYIDFFQIKKNILNSSIIEDVSCLKCENLVVNPSQCKLCEKVFCKKCTSECIVCRIKLNEPSRLIIKLLKELNIKCKICNTKLSYESLETHLNLCKEKIFKDHLSDDYTIINLENENFSSNIENILYRIDLLEEKMKEKDEKISLLENEIRNYKNFQINLPENNFKELELIRKNLHDNTIRIKELDQKIFKVIKKNNQNENFIITLQEDYNRILEINQKDIRKLRICQLKCNFAGDNYKSFSGHTASITCIIQIIWEKDENTFASGSRDGTIKIWNNDCLRTLQSDSGIIWSMCQIYENLISSSNQIKLWNIETGECINTLDYHTASVTVILNSNNYLISGSEDKKVVIWDKEFKPSLCLIGHSSTVNCIINISWTRIENYIVTGSRDESIIIWDTDKGVNVRKLLGHTDSIRCLTYVKWEKNDYTILSGSEDNSIRIWNIDTSECLKVLNEHSSIVNCLVQLIWEKDETTFVSGGYDNNIKMWNIESGECLRTLKGHKGAVNCLIHFNWSKNQTTIMSGSDDKTIKVWN